MLDTPESAETAAAPVAAAPGTTGRSQGEEDDLREAAWDASTSDCTRSKDRIESKGKTCAPPSSVSSDTAWTVTAAMGPITSCSTRASGNSSALRMRTTVFASYF